MLKKWCTLILMVFLMAGCAHRHKTIQTPLITKASTSSIQYRQPGSFSQLDIRGRVNVRLHTGYKKPRLILRGDPADLAQVKLFIKNHTLYVILDSGLPRFGEVSVDVQGHVLNSIRYTGAGVITGNQLRTNALDLYLANQGTTNLTGTLGLQRLVVNGTGAVQLSGVNSYQLKVILKGNPKVKLSGVANLATLNVDGDGWFSLYWVKSNKLKVCAKKQAKIQLAGVVNTLNLELWNKASFKGRYLRAKRSFVKTHDFSLAEISSVHHQSTLATNASDIYYYNTPSTRADFMAFNGSVLNMQEFDQNETRYNKQMP